MDKKNLLIVDDAELFLQMEQSFLKRDDFILHTAKSGAQAIEMAKAILPDLILLDLYMPDMNGDQVCRKLKDIEELKKTSVLIVTSEKIGPRLVSCVEAGCDGFIYKPFSREQLLGKVQKQLVIAQRQFRRVSTQIPCVITIDDTRLDTEISTLSEGGAFINMGIPVDPGTSLLLEFTLPDSLYPVNTEVIVRWSVNIERNFKPAGIGVEFLTVTGGEMELIRHFTEFEHKRAQLKKIGVEELPRS